MIPRLGQPASIRVRLQQFGGMLVEISENVALLKMRGWSLDEIIARKPATANDAVQGGFLTGPQFLTKPVYEGV